MGEEERCVCKISCDSPSFSILNHHRGGATIIAAGRARSFVHRHCALGFYAPMNPASLSAWYTAMKNSGTSPTCEMIPPSRRASGPPVE